MSVVRFPLPETVDLKAASGLAQDLLQHIRNVAEPSVTSDGLRQGGVPLLQILVSAKAFATAQGKSFTVQAEPDGALARLLATYGLDPNHCGAPADVGPSVMANPSKRT